MFIILLKEGESVMPDLKTYGQIYDEEFLEKFGKYRGDVEKAKLVKEFEVDVKKIAKLCKIEVTEDDLDVVEDQDEMGACKKMHATHKSASVEYETDIEKRHIVINKYISNQRQRFLIAHEIGYILMGFKAPKDAGKFQVELEKFISDVNSINANFFAVELLMPEDLLRDALEHIMSELNYDSTKKFSSTDIDILTDKTSILMNVPRETLKYRLRELDIFG